MDSTDNSVTFHPFPALRSHKRPLAMLSQLSSHKFYSCTSVFAISFALPFPGHSTPMTKSFLSHLRSRPDFGF